MDELSPYTSAGQAVFAGLVSGLVMGDLTTGLYIGGAMQLTVLGVGTFGGSSRIDANSGTVIATAFAVASSMDPQQAFAVIATPVAALMTYTDIIGRFSDTFWAHRCDADVENMAWGSYNFHYLMGGVSWMLSRALLVFLALAFGQNLIDPVVAALNGDPAWLGKGLTVAGGTLPAVGFAILLRYLPVKKHVAYLLLGFATTAVFVTLFGYIGSLNADIAAVGGLVDGAQLTGQYNGLPMLLVALIGLALSLIYYKSDQAAPAVQATAAVEIGDDDDEL
nr:PTS sugar transporter subunit IIC [Collinsella urealyticum]